jgi:anti-sigma B factor antagonist
MDHDTGALPSAEALLVIDQARVGEVVVLTCRGEVDAATAEQLRSAVAEGLRDPDGGPVVLDLTEVTFLSSTGLHALVDAQRAAARIGEPLRIVVDHARPVLRPIQLTGLDEVLTLYHFVDNAVRGDTAAEGHSGDVGDTDFT